MKKENNLWIWMGVFFFLGINLFSQSDLIQSEPYLNRMPRIEDYENLFESSDNADLSLRERTWGNNPSLPAVAGQSNLNSSSINLPSLPNNSNQSRVVSENQAGVRANMPLPDQMRMEQLLKEQARLEEMNRFLISQNSALLDSPSVTPGPAVQNFSFPSSSVQNVIQPPLSHNPPYASIEIAQNAAITKLEERKQDILYILSQEELRLREGVSQKENEVYDRLNTQHQKNLLVLEENTKRFVQELKNGRILLENDLDKKAVNLFFDLEKKGYRVLEDLVAQVRAQLGQEKQLVMNDLDKYVIEVLKRIDGREVRVSELLDANESRIADLRDTKVPAVGFKASTQRVMDTPSFLDSSGVESKSSEKLSVFENDIQETKQWDSERVYDENCGFQGGFFIQIGTYREPSNLQKNIQKSLSILPAGSNVYVCQNENGLARLILGPFTAEQRIRMLAQFKAKGYSDAFLLSY